MKNKELLPAVEETPNEEIKSAKTHKPSDKRNKSLKMISISSAILFIAIVIVINVVFESFLGSSMKWDWSQTNLYTLGDVTKKILSDLDQDITIIGLYDKGTVSKYSDIEAVLDEYVKAGNGKITVQYIDPVKTPAILTQLDPDDLLSLESQTFVVHCAALKKSRKLDYYDCYQTEYDSSYQLQVTGITIEEAFTGSIRYASSEKTPVVYMTKGQGEADYAEDYKTLHSMLQDNNFIVKDLDLITATEIPSDAELLIMLGPTSDINKASKNLIGGYLQKGKSLMVLTDYSTSTFPVLNELLAEYNLEISDNRVRESNTDRQYNKDAYFFLCDAPASVITAQAINKATLVDNVRAMNQLNNAKDYITVSPVLQTSEMGLIEIGGNPDKTDPAAIATIALASEDKGYVDGKDVTTSAKVMIFGMTSFIDDDVLGALGSQVYNIYSFYSSVRWLMNADTNSDLLITAKKVPSYYLVSDSNNTAYWAATIVCVILIPIGLMIAALVVYRKRKNL